MKKMILYIISGLLISFYVSAEQATGASALTDEPIAKHESNQPTTNTQSPIKGMVGASLYALQKPLVSYQETSTDYTKLWVAAMATQDYLSWYYPYYMLENPSLSEARATLIISTHKRIDELYPSDPGTKNMSEVYKEAVIKEAEIVGKEFPPWSGNDEK